MVMVLSLFRRLHLSYPTDPISGQAKCSRNLISSEVLTYSDPGTILCVAKTHKRTPAWRTIKTRPKGHVMTTKKLTLAEATAAARITRVLDYNHKD
jgi:hypothetical protein